jgi:pimeloyl-ACP methyl ester carboxylesterase
MAAMSIRPAVLEFGGFRLDPASGRLLKGGRPVPLAPKAFAVLQHLASRGGQLVPKQELFSTFWSDAFVGDAVLKATIREIRKALNDEPKTPHFIETAHRRGYRFIADVREVAGDNVGAPPVYYAQSGNVNIAYQVVGSGPIDLVFVMGWVSHLEYFWKEPRFARFLTRLSSMARLILFDKRGTGRSDPVPVSQLPTLDERLDDVRAVMAAAGSERAVLMGVSEGGPLCTLFSATYPEKTEALVMIGSYARRFAAPDYPWGQTLEDADTFCLAIREGWGGPVGIESRAPSVADDPEFRAWWAAYLRMGASPGAALALTQMNGQIDVRDVLPTVRVPTLILHRRGDRCLPVEGGRYMASRIPGASFVELPGDDHLPFVGDQDQMLEEIERFISRTHQRPSSAHTLATVLVVLADGARHADFDHAFATEVSTHRGVIVDRNERDSTMRRAASFDGPGRAVRCARALSDIATRLRIQIRAAVHIGEFDPSAPDGLTSATARIAASAPIGSVLVSRTVVDLVHGSGLTFTAHGSATVATDRQVPIFAVETS